MLIIVPSKVRAVRRRWIVCLQHSFLEKTFLTRRTQNGVTFYSNMWHNKTNPCKATSLRGECKRHYYTTGREAFSSNQTKHTRGRSSIKPTCMESTLRCSVPTAVARGDIPKRNGSCLRSRIPNPISREKATWYLRCVSPNRKIVKLVNAKPSELLSHCTSQGH